MATDSTESLTPQAISKAEAFDRICGYTFGLRYDARLNREDDPVLFDLVQFIDTVVERVVESTPGLPFGRRASGQHSNPAGDIPQSG